MKKKSDRSSYELMNSIFLLLSLLIFFHYLYILGFNPLWQDYLEKIFLSFCKLCLHSVDCFLCRATSFKTETGPLVNSCSYVLQYWSPFQEVFAYAWLFNCFFLFFSRVFLDHTLSSLISFELIIMQRGKLLVLIYSLHSEVLSSCISIWKTLLFPLVQIYRWKE